VRYLTTSGCYAWIHSYTRDITLLRPEEYDAATDDAAVSLQLVLLSSIRYAVVAVCMDVGVECAHAYTYSKGYVAYFYSMCQQ
jgi:hypothetical protein